MARGGPPLRFALAGVGAGHGLWLIWSRGKGLDRHALEERGENEKEIEGDKVAHERCVVPPIFTCVRWLCARPAERSAGAPAPNVIPYLHSTTHDIYICNFDH